MQERKRLSDWSPAVAAPITKKFEGLSLKAYKCPAGHWTIGYGSTRMLSGAPVMQGDRITKPEADVLLQKTLREARDGAARHCSALLTEGQAAAIIDFTFNVGEGKFARSTLCAKLRGMPGTEVECAYEFLKWKYAGGRELPGLVLRREAEKASFLS